MATRISIPSKDATKWCCDVVKVGCGCNACFLRDAWCVMRDASCCRHAWRWKSPQENETVWKGWFLYLWGWDLVTQLIVDTDAKEERKKRERDERKFSLCSLAYTYSGISCWSESGGGANPLSEPLKRGEWVLKVGKTSGLSPITTSPPTTK